MDRAGDLAGESLFPRCFALVGVVLRLVLGIISCEVRFRHMFVRLRLGFALGITTPTWAKYLGKRESCP